MKALLFQFDKDLNLVEKALAVIAAVIADLTMFAITADVILRYFFRKPIVGLFELSSMAMIGIVFLSVAYVQSMKGHVTVSILTDRMRPRNRLVLSIIGSLLGIACLFVLTWANGQSAWEAWSRGQYAMGLVQWPLWPAKAIIPLGLGLLVIRLILDLVKDMQKLFSPKVTA